MLSWIKNISLSWKVQIAPALLVLVLLGVGAYALMALRSNQAAVDALISGPVRQSEIANDLTNTAWIAHAKLYRLAAVAANEKDEKKVADFARETSAAAAKIPDALKAVANCSLASPVNARRCWTKTSPMRSSRLAPARSLRVFRAMAKACDFPGRPISRRRNWASSGNSR